MTNARKQSRREFLAMSALGFVGFARGAKQLSLRKESQLGDELLYVGTYTDDGRSAGIYLVRMDTRSGQLRLVGSIDAKPNPSFLAIHPGGHTLYAVNEVGGYNGKASGAVSSYTIATNTGALTKIGEQPSEGAGPCYVSVDRSGRVVLVANYDGGSIALLPVERDGSVARATWVLKHTGSGPVSDRQGEPHAHCIVADPSDHYVLAADLGADRVFVYSLDPDGKSLRHVDGGDAVMRPGAGPRHIAFHPKAPLVFVSNELDSTVTSLRFDAKRGALSVVDTQSTLPADWKSANYPADIHIAPSGRTVYVSNRGHNSIAALSVAANGRLSLKQTISTEGDWPRNFTLDPTGRWLLVANQKSDSIVVFARDPKSSNLTPTHHRIEIASPSCLRFRTHSV
ncbi:MAG TPA: lactonase family protein [Gemmatimonadaceae bacterium]|nr:lactonase family protein [Gemmatimonadaceae bacterium]